MCVSIALALLAFASLRQITTSPTDDTSNGINRSPHRTDGEAEAYVELRQVGQQDLGEQGKHLQISSQSLELGQVTRHAWDLKFVVHRLQLS